MREIFLKPGRERSVQNRHPWVFTGAVARAAGPANAAVATVHDARGTLLGSGFHSPHSQIIVRLVTRGDEPLSPETLDERIGRAIDRRSTFEGTGTDAYRLIHSEGDGLSGLIVDRYADLMVVEIGSFGLAQWEEPLVASLRRHAPHRLVYFKNDLPARRLEKLPLDDAWSGEGDPVAVIAENGLRFHVDPFAGQKSGFFLDQRENRELIRSMASGRSVLNLFSYTGAFGIYAAAGGASSVTEVDISAPAIEMARQNYRLNGLREAEMVIADAFEQTRRYVQQQRRFDLVVCDPPAFARSRNAVERAARGYKDINMQALSLVEPGGHLLTFSCSGHVSLDLFQKVVFSAALDAEREVSIIRRLGAGRDHPISIFCPEGEYLKGFVLRVE